MLASGARINDDIFDVAHVSTVPDEFLLDEDASCGDDLVGSIVFDDADYVIVAVGCEVMESGLEFFVGDGNAVGEL